MALPRINETLNFTMKVPSTGKTIKYRPYLVKEEKVLLQAFESGDTKTCLEAMVDTLAACIDPKSNLDVASLATFDVEYMFIKVRSKSVGETSKVSVNCNECQAPNEYTVELDQIGVNVEKVDNVIQLTDEIAVEMKYPTYDHIADETVTEGSDTAAAMAVLTKCISAVLMSEERIDASESTLEELTEFVESMTANQLQLLSDFLEGMPAVKHEIEFTCKSCKHENKLELKGLADFF
jgi:hypothetical protein